MFRSCAALNRGYIKIHIPPKNSNIEIVLVKIFSLKQKLKKKIPAITLFFL